MPNNNTSGTPPTTAAEPPGDAAALAFIARWQGVTASELSISQSYMFERPITFAHGDGSTSAGRVDCYKRGHFVWESKKLKAGLVAQATGSVPSKTLAPHRWSVRCGGFEWAAKGVRGPGIGVFPNACCLAGDGGQNG